MAETAAELIAGLGRPKYTKACPEPGCGRVVGPYYNGGDMTGAFNTHMRAVHGIDMRERSENHNVEFRLAKAGISPRGFKVH